MNEILIAVVTTLGVTVTAGASVWRVFYKSNGETIRQQILSLRQENEDMRREIANLKIQITPNKTPRIMVDSKEKIATYNDAAVTKIFSRLGISGPDIRGKNISEALGLHDFSLIRSAIASDDQVARSAEFIMGSRITVYYAVAYVIIDGNKDDFLVEVQFIV